MHFWKILTISKNSKDPINLQFSVLSQLTTSSLGGGGWFRPVRGSAYDYAKLLLLIATSILIRQYCTPLLRNISAVLAGDDQLKDVAGGGWQMARRLGPATPKILSIEAAIIRWHMVETSRSITNCLLRHKYFSVLVTTWHGWIIFTWKGNNTNLFKDVCFDSRPCSIRRKTPFCIVPIAVNGCSLATVEHAAKFTNTKL